MSCHVGQAVNYHLLTKGLNHTRVHIAFTESNQYYHKIISFYSCYSSLDRSVSVTAAIKLRQIHMTSYPVILTPQSEGTNKGPGVKKCNIESAFKI